jgi:glycosyltransferase involved in cell wall biosynthesis
MITWSMGLPVHILESSIDHQRYNYDPNLKRPQLSYIKRKGINIDQLKRMMAARNSAYINNIKWVGLDGLPEAQYALEIGRSSIFVNLSLAEGYPTSCLEAMAAGTVVVSYDSLCSRTILCGQKAEQNCVLVPNGDYPALAYALEPVLKDCLYGKMEKWRSIIARGLKTAAGVTMEREKRSLISFWRKVC